MPCELQAMQLCLKCHEYEKSAGTTSERERKVLKTPVYGGPGGSTDYHTHGLDSHIRVEHVDVNFCKLVQELTRQKHQHARTRIGYRTRFRLESRSSRFHESSAPCSCTGLERQPTATCVLLRHSC